MNAFAQGFDKIIAVSIASAMDVMFLGEVAKHENDEVADMFIAVKIITVRVPDMGKLGIIDDLGKLAVGHFHGFHHSALGADEKNVDICICAGKGEKLTRGEKLSRDLVSMRRGAENAGNGETDLVVLRVFKGKLRATALAFEFDDIARERKCADNAEYGRAAMRTAISKGRIFGL